MRARGGKAPTAQAAVRASDSEPVAITLGCGVRGAKGKTIYDRRFFLGLLRSSPRNLLIGSTFTAFRQHTRVERSETLGYTGTDKSFGLKGRRKR
jgi:hypothetical protein